MSNSTLILFMYEKKTLLNSWTFCKIWTGSASSLVISVQWWKIHCGKRIQADACKQIEIRTCHSICLWYSSNNTNVTSVHHPAPNKYNDSLSKHHLRPACSVKWVLSLLVKIQYGNTRAFLNIDLFRKFS